MRRKGQGFSLQTALLASFLVCVGILLLFMASTLVPSVSELLSTNAIERTRETVLQSVNSVDIYIDSMLSTLHFASTLLTGDLSGADDGWKASLRLLQKSNTDITAMAFFNGEGECLFSSAGTSRVAPSAIRQTDWFQKALAWDGSVAYFSKPHVQSLFGEQRALVITVARAVEYQQYSRQRTGVLMMDLSYSSFSALCNAVRLGASGYAYILDAEGTMIAHPDQPLIDAGLKNEDTTAIMEQVFGLTRDVQNGRERVLVIDSLSQTRWRMVGVAYIDEILQLQSAFIRLMTLVLICAALLSFGAATLVAYLVTRPIRHLEHKMLKVEAGDLNVTITEKGVREIRAVSSAFNHMLTRIRALMDQIVQEQEKKRLYELNALQAQINPHFLYNTLDSIIWMEERGRNREAITMVSALAKLFRISISKGRSVITVGEEIEHVRNYVIIQKMRFKDKFDCTITSQEEALQERTVKLIVQPLVENAINHAIDEIEGTTLHIRVDVRVEGELLLFTVSDDGVGIPQEQLENILHTATGQSGIGVKNVHERIQLTFGPEYGLHIESEEDVGTTVTIRLPRAKERSV